MDRTKNPLRHKIVNKNFQPKAFEVTSKGRNQNTSTVVTEESYWNKNDKILILKIKYSSKN